MAKARIPAATLASNDSGCGSRVRIDLPSTAMVAPPKPPTRAPTAAFALTDGSVAQALERAISAARMHELGRGRRREAIDVVVAKPGVGVDLTELRCAVGDAALATAGLAHRIARGSAGRLRWRGRRRAVHCRCVAQSRIDCDIGARVYNGGRRRRNFI
jgi:hypothetical protein